MPIICLDTEYDARYSDRGVSRLACMSYAIDKGPAQLVGYRDGVKLWTAWARDPTVRFVTHGGPNDFAVLADEAHLVFEGELPEAPGVGPYWELAHSLYERRRVYDTATAQRLTHIRYGPHKGNVQLGALAKQLFGIDLGDTKKIPAEARELLNAAIAYDEWPQDVLEQTPWRVKYGWLRELHDNDVSSYPQAAQDYALEDARLPLRVRATQARMWKRPIPDLYEQTLHDWMLHMVSIPGWCADRPRAQSIRKIYRKTIDNCERTLLNARLLEVEPPRLVQKQDKLKALVFAALREATPVSKTARAIAKERGTSLTTEELREYAATDAKTCARAIEAQGGPILGTTPKKSAASFEGALAELAAQLAQDKPWTPLYAHWMRGKSGGLLAKGDERSRVKACAWACERVLVDAGVLELVPEKVTVKSKRVAERVYLRLGESAKLTDKGYELYGGTATPEQQLAYCAKDAKAIRAAILNIGATPLNIADAVEKSEEGSDAFDQWLDDSGEGVLNALAVRSKADKTIVNFLNKLDCDRRIRTSYVSTLDTGRTSARGSGGPGTLNIQQLPRDYDKPKYLHTRGCIVPPPGWCFLVADYTQLELCALAHILTKLVRFYASAPHRKKTAERMLGFSISEMYTSTLARAINDDQDCHVRMASVLRSSTYAECIGLYKIASAKKERGDALSTAEAKMIADRQLSKPCNFGFPGGLGALAFVDYAAGYGVSITSAIAAKAKAAYMAAWPEMKLYFYHIKQSIKRREDKGWYGGLCKQIGSGRLRGDCTFTQWANGWFQGLAADGAKWAGWLLVDAAYRRPESPMYGTRPSGFVHDEYLTNARVEQAERALPEQERLMVEGMRKWIPDVSIKAPGKILYERWAK